MLALPAETVGRTPAEQHKVVAEEVSAPTNETSPATSPVDSGRPDSDDEDWAELHQVYGAMAETDGSKKAERPAAQDLLSDPRLLDALKEAGRIADIRANQDRGFVTGTRDEIYAKLERKALVEFIRTDRDKVAAYFEQPEGALSPEAQKVRDALVFVWNANKDSKVPTPPADPSVAAASPQIEAAATSASKEAKSDKNAEMSDEEFHGLLTDDVEARFKALWLDQKASKEGSPVLDDKAFLLTVKAYMEQNPNGAWEKNLTQLEAKKTTEAESAKADFKEKQKKTKEGLAEQLKDITGLEVLLQSATGTEKTRIEAELEVAKIAYEKNRADFVGDNAAHVLGERLRDATKRVEEVAAQKGIFGKGLKKLYDGYKWLGEKNLEKVMTSKWDNRFTRMVGKAMSLRTVVNLTLGGFAVWGGAGVTASMGALAMRRIMSGGGASIASYDAMKHFSDRGMMDASPESVKDMSAADIVKKLEVIEAKAQVAGDPKLLAGNPAYEALRAGLIERIREDGQGTLLESYLKDTDANIAALAKKRKIKHGVFLGAAALIGGFVGGGYLADGVRKLMGAQEAVSSVKGAVANEVATAKAERAAKGAAQAAKAAVASESAPMKPSVDLSYKDAYQRQETSPWKVEEVPQGEKTLLSKNMTLKTDAPPAPEQVTFSDAEASATPPESALTSDTTPSQELGDTRAPSSDLPPPGASDAAPLPEAVNAKPGLDLVGKGDGYVKVFTRQIEADPAKFGFDPSKDGDPTKWAKKLAGKIAKEQGLMDRGLRAGARVTLGEDLKVNLSEGGDYVRSPKVDLTKALEDFGDGAKEPSLDAQGRPTDLTFGPDGTGSARFVYGESGVVKDVQIDGGRMPTDAEMGEVLKGDWAKKVADSRVGIGNFEQAKLELATKVERLRSMAEIEKRLIAEGEGNTPAAQFLRKRMKLEMMVINKDFLGAVSDDMARDVNSRINEAAKVMRNIVPKEGAVNEAVARPKFESSVYESKTTTTLEDPSSATSSQNEMLKGSVFAPFEGEGVAVPPEAAAVAPKPERPVAKFFKSIGNWFKDAGKAIVNIPKATGENMQDTMEQNQAMRDATSAQREKDYWEKFGGKGPGANPPDVKR